MSRAATAALALAVTAIAAAAMAAMAAAVAPESEKTTEPLTVWNLRSGIPDPAAAQAPAAPVGSIQKIWVARAWAEAHPDPADSIPRFGCGPSSGCWNRRGHGPLGLRRATSVSCNSYFLALAQGLPRPAAERTFRAAGFDLHGVLSPERMVGLDTSGRPVTIRPARLLESFRSLLVEPWMSREDVRSELIGGMRDSSEDGTGSLVPRPELVVKTGTVASLDDTPLATSGWAISADPTGETVRLALLRNGSGALAAARLAAIWQAEGRGRLAPKPIPRKGEESASSDPRRRPLPSAIRVRLFGALAPKKIVAMNAGPFPLRADTAPGTAEWVGPAASRELAAGALLSRGTWELSVEPYGLVRVVRGSLESGDGRHPVLTTSLRDWVEGVLRSEARGLPAERLREFVPVVLRFLRRGPRHGREDVCDLSHCCVFSGFGPHAAWRRPDAAVLEAGPASRSGPVVIQTVLSDPEWREAVETSDSAGPSLWSGHCGGRPLSEREVWGSGSSEAHSCSRANRHELAEPWSRSISDETFYAVFHRRPLAVEAVERGGVRKTEVTFADGEVAFLWDDLHQRLARAVGWDALPSPPDSWTRAGSGWKASGRGRGHRTGYCLGD